MKHAKIFDLQNCCIKLFVDYYEVYLTLTDKMQMSSDCLRFSKRTMCVNYSC